VRFAPSGGPSASTEGVGHVMTAATHAKIKPHEPVAEEDKDPVYYKYYGVIGKQRRSPWQAQPKLERIHIIPGATISRHALYMYMCTSLSILAQYTHTQSL